MHKADDRFSSTVQKQSYCVQCSIPCYHWFRYYFPTLMTRAIRNWVISRILWNGLLHWRLRIECRCYPIWDCLCKYSAKECFSVHTRHCSKLTCWRMTARGDILLAVQTHSSCRGARDTRISLSMYRQILSMADLRLTMDRLIS